MNLLRNEYTFSIFDKFLCNPHLDTLRSRTLKISLKLFAIALIALFQTFVVSGAENTILKNNTSLDNPPIATTQTYNTAGTYTFTVPAGVTTITVDTWGGGGRGGSRTSGSSGYGGGGGGAFSRHTLSVTPGQTYNVTVGAGATSTVAGGDSWVSISTVGSAFVLAKGGLSVANNTVAGGAGGSAAAGIGSIRFSGGNGANGTTTIGGGGGSSASPYGNGNAGTGSTGGVALTKGGTGGNGRTGSDGPGLPGSAPGGGGGGSYRTSTNTVGGNGGSGRVIITYAATEICNNGIDDDGDGLIDNADVDCSNLCLNGYLTLQRWSGITGSSITDLTSNSNYPNNPTLTTTISSFQGPNGIEDNYGTRVRGYLSPTVTGYYLFNVISDDQSELYLSTDANPANRSLIASVSGWTGEAEYTKYASQTSSEIYLVAGQNYYIELLHKEGGGGDHFLVSWEPPTSTTWSTIPGTNLKQFICGENCSNGIDDDGDGLIDCQDPDCGLISNFDFDYGTQEYSLFVQGGAAATWSVDNTSQLNGTNSARVNVTTATGTDWNVQLVQGNKNLTAGVKYKIHFKAKASVNRTMSVALQLGVSPYTGYFYQTVNLTTNYNDYYFEYTPTTNLTQTGLYFNLGTSTGQVFLDDLVVQEICPIVCPVGQCSSSELVNNGTFDNNVSGWTTNGTVEIGGGGPWGNFMILNNADAAGPFTAYQDETFGANKPYLFSFVAGKHATTNNAKVYLEFYNGTTYLSQTPDFNVLKNYDGTFQYFGPFTGVTPPNTTKIRIVCYAAGTALKIDNLVLTGCVTCPEICNNGLDDDGDGFIDCLDSDCTMPDALVDLDASNLTLGALSSFTNFGTLGGTFSNNGTTPTVQTVSGRKAVTFDGTDVMISSFNAPSGITGNSDYSIAAWVFNPSIADEEAILSWSYRGGPDGTNAHLNYGSNSSYGAVSHWGTPDMQYVNGAPTAGVWHHIVLTYAGGTNGIEKLYVDGVLNNEEAKTLNIYANQPLHLGAARSASSGGSSLFFTGSIAKVSVYNSVLTPNQVQLLSTSSLCSEICGNGVDDDGDGLTDCADPDCGVVANAGPDVTQCNNAAFSLQANALNPGETGVWSVISGNIIANGDIYSNSITAIVPAGSTGTGRWTVTKGGCSAFDNIVLTNTTGCSTACIDPINVNGDLEAEGNATNFNLTFQGTPALLIEGVTNPEGWASRYGTNPTSTTNFTGAFYLKKTGTAGNPRSGTHMIYLKGAGFCLSALQNIGNLSCGKTYQFSVWAAAYSNTTTQSNAPFALEFGTGSDLGVPVPYYSHVELMAPASTSWNNLNWQRYSFTITIPENGFDWSDFYFTSYDNTHGIVLDDICVTEINTGSYSNAGPDQKLCSNFFNLNANTPPAGYTGTWSVLSGNVSFSNVNSPTSTATITSGNTARIKWVVSSGSCWSLDEMVISYTAASSISVNNPTICPGTNTTLTVSGCTGNVVWSTGETTTSITVNPSTTTNYTVSCTSSPSGNLVLNPGFESATNFQNWTDWGHSSVTTVAGEVRSGSKAAKVNTIDYWGGFGQDIAVTPGELITINFWGKALNPNVFSSFDYKFMNASWADVTQYQSTRISTSTYTQYTVTMVAPPNATWLQLAFTSSTPSILYIDDVSFVKITGCVSTATSTVSMATSGCQEICDNGIDDDNNGLIDAQDPFCNCANTTNGGIISGNEVSCTNYNPGIISSVSAASGNAGTIQYQWEYSNNNINWVQISGATSLTYDPGFIYQTTYFRRRSKISTCGYWGAVSNTVTKQDFSFDNFQVLTLGDVTFNGSTHVHGPLAAGGNLNINSSGGKVEVNMDNTGTYIFPGDGSVSTGMMIRGGINFTSGYLGVLSNRYLHIGNNTNLASSDNGNNSSTQVFPFGTNYNNSLRIETTIDQTPLPAVFQTVGYDFDNLFNYFNANSLSLGARTNNVQLYNTSNVAITNNIVTSAQPIRIKDLVTGYNYLNLTTSSINNISEWNFETNAQPSATKVLVINVPVTANFNWNNTNITGLVASSNAPYIIWNFYGSTVNTVTISGNSLIFGSIMAPNQNVVKTGINDMEGSIIARSATLGTGQLHDFMFADFCGLFSCTNVVSASVTGTNTICQGVSTTLTATGGGTYLWSTGATTAAITVTPSITTTYSVTVTESSGCTATANRTVTVNALPTAAISGTNTICTGSSTTLTASGGTSYVWSNAATTAAITVSPTATTTYIVTVTNAQGCTATSSRTVTVNALPTAAISGTNTICNGASTTLTASGGTSYVWSNAATTAAITVSPTATTTYIVTVTNAQGCTATSSRIVTVNALPTAAISGTNTICAGSSTTLTASGGTSYVWSNAATTAAITVSPTATTTYIVTVTNAQGCTATSSRIVTVNALPTAAIAGTNTICNGSSTTLTASGGTSYVWSNAATTAAITVSPTVTTTYIVTVTNAQGCTATSSRTVTVNALPTIATTTPGARCGTGTVVLGATASTGTLNWYAASTGGTSLGTGISFTTPSISATTTYFVDATNTGCTSTRTAVVATVNANPTANIVGDNYTCNSGVTTTGSHFFALADNGNNPALYRIDANGVSSFIGSLGISQDIEAIEINENATKLYGVASENNAQPAKLGFININNGLWTEIGNIGNTTGPSVFEPKDIDAISFDAAGNLWAISNNPVQAILFKIDTLTGSIVRNTFGAGVDYTQISGPASSANIEAIAFDKVSNVFYLSGWFSGPDAKLFTLNISNGVSSLVADLVHCNEDIEGLVITQDGKMFASSGNGGNGGPDDSSCFNRLYSVDKVSGQLTLISQISNIHNDFEALTAPGVPTTILKANGGGTYLWSNGMTTNQIIAVEGIYTVTVTSTAGCTSTVEHTINDVNFQASITGNDIICVGNSSVFTASLGSAYLWGTGATTASITVSSAGTYTVTVTNSTGCISTASRVLTVTNSNAVSSNATTTLCINTTLSPSITHTTTGATGIGTATGLPTGVTASWASNMITISGTPTASGTFNYTIPLTGGCGTVNAMGTIIVTPSKTVTSNATTTLCINTTISPSITHTTTGATGIGTATGLPAGVTAVWASNTITISGTPTASGTFNYSIPLTGGCGNVNATGTIVVNARPGTKIISSASRCGSGSVTLAVLFGSGNSNWYDAPTGGTLLYSGNSFTTPSLSATTTYYIEGEQNGCISATRQAITATINPVPVATVTGVNEICAGASTTLTASGGNTYLWSNSATTASINVNPTATTAYVVTVTNTQGCTATSSYTVNVKSIPTITINKVDHPCGGITLTANGGTSYAWSNGANTQIIDVNPLFFTTYRVTVTNAEGCTASSSIAVQINTGPEATACLDFPSGRAPCFGTIEICEGELAGLRGKAYGNGPFTFNWDNGVGAGADHDILLSADGLETKNYIFTLTVTDTNGCTSSSEATVMVHGKPVAAISGPNVICHAGSTVLTASGVGTYLWSNGATTSSINVSPTALTPYTVTVTNSYGCTSTATKSVNVSSPMSVSIDYKGSVCLETNKQISANVSGGTPTYTYQWTGPSGFTGNTETITITNNGNYYLTVTDVNGCSAVTSGFIYQQFDPFIVSLNTTVCEGESVNLQVNSSSAVSYQWSANAGNAIINAVTVIPTLPSSTYQVTVTNDLGCTAVPTVDINVNPKPIVSVSGTTNICPGTTTNLTPSTGGTWTSTNPSVATVTNAGVVTGWNAGTATFIFTNTSTGCVSNPSTQVTVNPTPTVSISGPSTICISSTTQLLPSSGGTWVSNNPSIATVNNMGVVTGLSSGNTTFVFTSSSTGCVSTNTESVFVESKQGVVISGPSEVCMDDNIQLTSSKSGGSWSSSNIAVATINAAGIITPISAGNVIITYVHNSGACSEDATKAIIVHALPTVTFNGPNSICLNQMTNLSPNIGGTWVSNHPSIATVNNAGLVTGIAAGNATFTFTNTATGCVSLPSAQLTVKPLPTVQITGASSLCINQMTTLSPSFGGTWSSSNPSVASVTVDGTVTALNTGTAYFTFTSSATSCSSTTSSPIVVAARPTVSVTGSKDVCIGGTTTLSPSSGGTWVSNNPSIASVSNTGVVTGLALGTASFTFTSSSSGCVSFATEDITVVSNPTVTLDYNGSVCLTDNSTLSAIASQGTPSYQYNWTGPNTFTGNTQTVSITQNGNYYLTITDSKGCMATTSGFVYQKYEPVIVNTQNTVCQGTSVNLQVNASGTPTYQWSPNAGNSNNPQVTVIPELPGSTYYVTVTNSQGCSVVANATINVNEKPTATLTGPSAICVGATTTFTPNANGTWVSSNPLIATISNTGIVTGIGPGNVHFIYTNSTTSCASDISPTIQVKAKPGISLDGEDAVCIGATTKFLPGSGGTWTSTNPSIASINNAGVVTAISAGQSTFIFTNTVSGCSSDASTPITIKPKPNAMFVGSQSICAGNTTQLAPSTGGTWITSNSAVAIVNSSGLVTGLTPGQARFTFVNLSTLCYSDEIGPVTVDAKPLVSISGPNQLCTGSTTQLSPSTGGTWVSNNPSVASVTNGGLVTALSEGQATFRFTNSVTGCVSSNTNVVTVYGRPSVGFSGASTICIGSTTNLYPANGGVWVSNNPSIASVGNNGVVTGLAAGTATFTFTETATGCTSNIPTPLTVGAKPSINDGGSATLCVGQTKSMTPNTGGYWSSNHPSIASITNNGLITAISQGVTNFYFTADNGCISDPSAPVAVSAKPSIASEANANLCVNTTLKLTSSTTGVWTSSNPSVATIANDGLINALNAGLVTFSIADANSGCISENSQLFTVVGRPNISNLGANNVCIGNTTNLSPTTGGTWVSNNPTIASITNAGVVTGIMSGAATFSFTETATGCTSTGVISVNVNPKPTITTDFSSLCIGSTGVINPSSGGTWVSQNPTIASINNSGVVTGLRQGVARFLFTSTATGCTSNSSAPIVILGKPAITLNGSNEICIGTTTTLFPTTGGTWVSDNPTVASINNQGIVTGLSEGQARFIFTDTNTGCSSDPSPAVTVGNSLQVSITGATSICLGYTTQLSPTVGGMWTSSNPSIAKVNGLGIVTGMAPGKVTFYFTASETGCISTLQENVLTVHSCVDPDFNVTSIHKTVVGNVQTNDDVPVGTTYGTSPFLVSRPSGSVVTFVMNTNGTYAFTADKPGVYTYNVPVCMPTTFQGCPTAVLTITVVDSQSGSMSMIPNIDIVSTTVNQAVTIFATSNDKCLNGVDCTIDPDKMTVMDGPANGTTTINTAGAIIYTPTSGFVGLDTVVYRICADATTTNCVTTMQIITVNAVSAVNTTVAADDFYTSYKDIALTGNVLINDNDPEGNNQVVTPQGGIGNPIIITQGSYYLLSNGELSFTPNEGFTGPVDIVYTVCDDQVLSVCAKATAHILIIEDMSIRIRVYLEGALINNGNQKATDNRPLMRDNLRVNPFNGTNVIPYEDPYTVATQYVNISNAFPHKASGLLTKYRSIKNPTAVLAVSGQDAIVDWVFVELRSKNDNREVLATRSGLLQRDGDVVDVDGVSPLAFSGVLVDSFYVVVRHRNHLGVMSQKVSNKSLIDFTKPSTPVFDFGTSLNNGYNYTGLAQKNDIIFGYSCMWGGDFDSNGRIKFVNPGDDQNILFFDVFASPENSQNTSNYNFALAYHQGDFDMNGKAKFDNPNDDKNYLFSQVLLHPLNTGLLSNFNFIIEQVPSRK